MDVNFVEVVGEKADEKEVIAMVEKSAKAAAVSLQWFMASKTEAKVQVKPPVKGER